MKKCNECGAEKPLSEFYKNSASADGVMSVCKPCNTERTRRWRKSNPEKTLACSREWARNNRSACCSASHRSREKNMGVVRAREKAYRESNRGKVRARDRVYRAIIEGVLKRPSRCSQCDCLCDAQAHHEDYSKPLAVEWLCPACHGERHWNDVV